MQLCPQNEEDVHETSAFFAEVSSAITPLFIASCIFGVAAFCLVFSDLGLC